jgi:hypothetical protein
MNCWSLMVVARVSGHSHETRFCANDAAVAHSFYAVLEHATSETDAAWQLSGPSVWRDAWTSGHAACSLHADSTCGAVWPWDQMILCFTWEVPRGDPGNHVFDS